MKISSVVSQALSAALVLPRCLSPLCCQMWLLTAVPTMGCICSHIGDTEP